MSHTGGWRSFSETLSKELLLEMDAEIQMQAVATLRTLVRTLNATPLASLGIPLTQEEAAVVKGPNPTLTLPLTQEEAAMSKKAKQTTGCWAKSCGSGVEGVTKGSQQDPAIVFMECAVAGAEANSPLKKSSLGQQWQVVEQVGLPPIRVRVRVRDRDRDRDRVRARVRSWWSRWAGLMY